MENFIKVFLFVFSLILNYSVTFLIYPLKFE